MKDRVLKYQFFSHSERMRVCRHFFGKVAEDSIMSKRHGCHN